MIYIKHREKENLEFRIRIEKYNRTQVHSENNQVDQENQVIRVLFSAFFCFSLCLKNIFPSFPLYTFFCLFCFSCLVSQDAILLLQQLTKLCYKKLCFSLFLKNIFFSFSLFLFFKSNPINPVFPIGIKVLCV